MKKSLALVLALIMVMGCMSFAAAEGGRTVTLNKQTSNACTVYVTLKVLMKRMAPLR